MLESLRETVWQLHLELPKNNLVTWTGGNISARDPESGYVVIKPSGVRYEHLRPEDMVIVDLHGQCIEGDLKPSSDTSSHLYRQRRAATESYIPILVRHCLCARSPIPSLTIG
jgi:L-ribulose-5-phosphate 4-epimerase